MASFKFSCPHCGKHVEAEEEWEGMEAECPHCGKIIVIHNEKISKINPEIPSNETPIKQKSRKYKLITAGVVVVCAATAFACIWNPFISKPSLPVTPQSASSDNQPTKVDQQKKRSSDNIEPNDVQPAKNKNKRSISIGPNDVQPAKNKKSISRETALSSNRSSEVKKPSSPQPKKTPRISLESATRINVMKDWGSELKNLVQYGCIAEPKNDFDRALAQREDNSVKKKLRDGISYFEISDLKIDADELSDNQKIVIKCPLPLRLIKSSRDLDAYGVLSPLDFSICDYMSYPVYCMTKNKTLVEMPWNYTIRSDHIAYLQECEWSTVYIQLRGESRELIAIGREIKNYRLRFVVSALRYGRVMTWGFFNIRALQENNFDTGFLRSIYLNGYSSSSEPEYFVIASRYRNTPRLVTAELEEIHLLDYRNKVVGELRKK